MSLFLTILIVIVAIFLVLIVIIQNSKGGGLAAGFSSSNQVMGVRKTTDFLEKATWTLAGVLVLLCICTTISLGKGGNTVSTKLDTEKVQDAAQPQGENLIFDEAAPQEEIAE